MSIEKRLAALESRLQTAEDTLEILNLVNSYGPLVDSGTAEAASKLWINGGGYNFNGGTMGGTRMQAPEHLVAMYESKDHMGLVNTGVSHFSGAPRIVIKGDEASAIGYSFVVLKEGDRWILWRAAINEWQLVRTPEGWRVSERFNRTLDGSPDSHEIMRKVINQ